MATIQTLAANLANGSITSVQMITQALEQIAAYQAAGGAAYISVDADAALSAAQISDKARAAGHVPSLLAGLPLSIKDLFDVKGQVTMAGSVVLADHAVATDDAPLVARLRNAGAVLLGRTNMSEFAFSGLGLNPHYGTPVNPLDAARIAGGSTSGGAVSVALNLAVAALGTDTGGSIRIPAAFCGLTGFKPSAQRLSLTGAIPLSRSLDSAGPIANSVACCALVDAVLSGQTLDTEARPLTGLRLGVCDTYVNTNLDEVVQHSFNHALTKLSDAGVIIEHFSFPELSELPAINRGGGLVAAEAWHWHRQMIATDSASYDQRVAARIERGSLQSAADYIDLLDARRRLILIAQQRLRNIDAWLMPTVATVAPLIAPLVSDDVTFFATNALVLRNTNVINFLDGCALSLPCHAQGALPVGLSICGLNGQDASILQISRSVEALLANN